MTRALTRSLAALLILNVVLAMLHFKPWEHFAYGGHVPRRELTVGFLPVTCHLTCPVTDFATRTSSSSRFVSQRYTDFPTVAEAFKAGRLDATFFIAPLAMKLREQGVPCHIVYLGHRDGSEVVVRKADPARNLRDLIGKRFAIPSRFSNQNLVIRKVMEDQGVNPADIQFIEMAPPDMPEALAHGAIDAYFVGEPFAGKAELNGTGRVLYYAKDIWPHFISCVLTVSDRLIKEDPGLVRDLVRGIARSGEWAETHRLDAAKVAAPYFRQDIKLLRYVLTQPPDRVSYRMLAPSDEDLLSIERMAVKAGILKRVMPVTEFLDRSFIPTDIKPADIDMASIGGEAR